MFDIFSWVIPLPCRFARPLHLEILFEILSEISKIWQLSYWCMCISSKSSGCCSWKLQLRLCSWNLDCFTFSECRLFNPVHAFPSQFIVKMFFVNCFLYCTDNSEWKQFWKRICDLPMQTEKKGLSLFVALTCETLGDVGRLHVFIGQIICCWCTCSQTGAVLANSTYVHLCPDY